MTERIVFIGEVGILKSKKKEYIVSKKGGLMQLHQSALYVVC